LGGLRVISKKRGFCRPPFRGPWTPDDLWPVKDEIGRRGGKAGVAIKQARAGKPLGDAPPARGSGGGASCKANLAVSRLRAWIGGKRVLHHRTQAYLAVRKETTHAIPPPPEGPHIPRSASNYGTEPMPVSLSFAGITPQPHHRTNLWGSKDLGSARPNRHQEPGRAEARARGNRHQSLQSRPPGQTPLPRGSSGNLSGGGRCSVTSPNRPKLRKAVAPF